MTADDPRAHRTHSPSRPPPTRTAFSDGGTPPDPLGPASAVVRPDGGRQVGVGPGAVVLHGSAQLEKGAGRTLGRALAGLDTPGAGSAARDVRVPPRCPVVGAGPLAARLWRALGEVPPDAPGPVQVVVHQHLVPPEVGVALARAGQVALPVVAQAHRVVVGPVVGPGRGPCLHCLDLHRRDRDSAWPVLATTLGHPTEQVVPVDVPEPLGRATEGLVLLVASSLLAGRPAPPGLSHELGSGAPHVVARRWLPHPGCPWHA